MANRCFLCHTCEESIDHLLIHCEKTREVWMLFLSFFGVSWVFPLSVKETLLGWRGSFVGKKRKAGVAIGTVMFVLGYMEGQKFNCFRGLRAVHSKAESIFCVFIVVGNQIVDKRWSFDLNRFYRVGVHALRRFFCFFPCCMGPFVRG